MSSVTGHAPGTCSCGCLGGGGSSATVCSCGSARATVSQASSGFGPENPAGLPSCTYAYGAPPPAVAGNPFAPALGFFTGFLSGFGYLWLICANSELGHAQIQIVQDFSGDTSVVYAYTINVDGNTCSPFAQLFGRPNTNESGPTYTGVQLT